MWPFSGIRKVMSCQINIIINSRWEFSFYLKWIFELKINTHTTILYCTVYTLQFGQVRLSLAGPLWVRHLRPPSWASLGVTLVWSDVNHLASHPKTECPSSASPYHWAGSASAGSAKPGGGKSLFATMNLLTWHMWLNCSCELNIIGYMYFIHYILRIKHILEFVHYFIF